MLPLVNTKVELLPFRFKCLICNVLLHFADRELAHVLLVAWQFLLYVLKLLLDLVLVNLLFFVHPGRHIGFKLLDVFALFQ